MLIEDKIFFYRNGESSIGGSLSDSGLESDAELAHSFDILPDMDFGMYTVKAIFCFMSSDGDMYSDGDQFSD